MNNLKIKIGHSPKTIELDDGRKIHFWYANNAGRGADNCTIIVSKAERAKTSAKQEDVLAYTRTSSWAGNVNFSKYVKNELGLIK